MVKLQVHHRQGISSSPAIERRITLIRLVVYVVTAALTMLSEVKRHGAFEEHCIIYIFLISLMNVLFQHIILSAFVQY